VNIPLVEQFRRSPGQPQGCRAASLTAHRQKLKPAEALLLPVSHSVWRVTIRSICVKYWLNNYDAALNIYETLLDQISKFRTSSA
jgi:hypothetical protein